ncbi:hypothetical protein [Myceligenerans pegani]|nr:hypothetical protein [Myceligenerans sp. TRM 65318]
MSRVHQSGAARREFFCRRQKGQQRWAEGARSPRSTAPISG